MKVLKQIFSPRRLLVWLFLIILILTVPEITRPSLSQTEAVVTMLCVEKNSDIIEVATTVLTPAQEKTPKYEVYKGVGKSIGEAVDSISLSIGKEMGFAQCEILGFGENICDEGVITSLDFFTRTKRVGRNAVLINFTGEADEFSQTVADLSMKKSLNLIDVLNYDDRYVLIEDCNVEAFYKGYFSEISLGIMPQIKFEKQETDNAIQVQATAGGSSSQEAGGSTSSAEQEKKYLVNDGTTLVFKNGKKHLDIEPEMVKKINIFVNKAQEGIIRVENVADDLYDNSTVIIAVQEKEVKIKPKFEGNKPIYEVGVELTVLIDEVINEQPDKNFLRRNKEFFTPELVKRAEETVTNNMNEAIAFCKENKIDMIDVYRYFYALKNKKFMQYYNQEKENYLDNIEYKISVKIVNDF